MSELKPCPFCGGEAEFYSYGGGGYGVSCTKCRCDVFSSWFHEEEAVEAWNTRAERTVILKANGRCPDCDKLVGEGERYCAYCGARVKEAE